MRGGLVVNRGDWGVVFLLALDEDLVEQGEDLWYVELHVLEVENVVVVLLLLSSRSRRRQMVSIR